MKTLLEAEAAANNAAKQLVSFKDAMDDEFAARFLLVVFFYCCRQNPKYILHMQSQAFSMATDYLYFPI